MLWVVILCFDRLQTIIILFHVLNDMTTLNNVYLYILVLAYDYVVSVQVYIYIFALACDCVVNFDFYNITVDKNYLLLYCSC